MHPLWRHGRTRKRTRVSTGNRDGGELLLAGRRGNVLVDGLLLLLLRRRRAGLLGRTTMPRRGRRLQRERPRLLDEALVPARILEVLLGEAVALLLALLGGVDVVVQVRREGGRGAGLEAGSVGRRLGAQLGQVQVGAGLVAQVHALVQLALGPEAVEDDAVDGDGDDLDDDLDDDADEGPVLGFVSFSFRWIQGGGSPVTGTAACS